MSDAPSLSDPERDALFDLVRATLRARLEGTPSPELPTGGPALEQRAGAFVTLRKAGQLRGCIGFIRTDRPLAESVRTLAISAAFEDTRFSPVSAEELPQLEVELSILTPPEVVPPEELPDAVLVGRDGLIVRLHGRSGLLLPQVASERDWDALTFLEQTSRKAGLPADAWRSPDAKIEAFRCEVYEEE